MQRIELGTLAVKSKRFWWKMGPVNWGRSSFRWRGHAHNIVENQCSQINKHDFTSRLKTVATFVSLIYFWELPVAVAIDKSNLVLFSLMHSCLCLMSLFELVAFHLLSIHFDATSTIVGFNVSRFITDYSLRPKERTRTTQVRLWQ